ncbi:hypothetical protein WEI85_18430 [Actinomycetes bacterium KLBMP 9797]
MAIPGSVQALAILLYIGGGLSALGAIMSGWPRVAIYLPIALAYLWLARKIQLGRPWARIVLMVLCGLGAVKAAVILVGDDVFGALSALAWPVVYAILVNTASARAWFRQANP